MEGGRAHPRAAALDFLDRLRPEFEALDAGLGLLGAGVIETRRCAFLESHLRVIVDPLALPHLLSHLQTSGKGIRLF